MAWDVHIHVCFECSENDPVAAIARRHLEGEFECREARWFLENLSERTGYNPGPKGGLSMWGMVGNHTDGDQFVSELFPFWNDLLSADMESSPFSDAHILVFVEAEQGRKAIAFEVFLDEDSGQPMLIVKKHDCPFAWVQH